MAPELIELILQFNGHRLEDMLRTSGVCRMWRYVTNSTHMQKHKQARKRAHTGELLEGTSN